MNKFHTDTPEQEKIVEIGEQWIALLLSKNRNYGNSVFKSPVLAPTLNPSSAIRVRMSDKIERLSNLLAGRDDEVGESELDTVADLGAYCLLYLVQKELEGNASSERKSTMRD